ncbi:hypothetical protein JCGZ_22049 [Jatropha curcas]|uniref:Uncharacterized protein n=1 Tax=Jatropha curcas TaxID=180498 RepID=A0A067LJ08_JATCU|nr:hypothetical protein JCGZ_22049 [Jatropha curcas]
MTGRPAMGRTMAGDVTKEEKGSYQPAKGWRCRKNSKENKRGRRYSEREEKENGQNGYYGFSTAF